MFPAWLAKEAIIALITSLPSLIRELKGLVTSWKGPKCRK